MKDKLIRYNHKRGFYIFKKTCFALAFIFASSAVLAIPVSFGIRVINETYSNTVKDESLQESDVLNY